MKKKYKINNLKHEKDTKILEWKIELQEIWEKFKTKKNDFKKKKLSSQSQMWLFLYAGIACWD